MPFCLFQCFLKTFRILRALWSPNSQRSSLSTTYIVKIILDSLAKTPNPKCEWKIFVNNEAASLAGGCGLRKDHWVSLWYLWQVNKQKKRGWTSERQQVCVQVCFYKVGLTICCFQTYKPFFKVRFVTFVWYCSMVTCTSYTCLEMVETDGICQGEVKLLCLGLRLSHIFFILPLYVTTVDFR